MEQARGMREHPARHTAGSNRRATTAFPSSSDAKWQKSRVGPAFRKLDSKTMARRELSEQGSPFISIAAVPIGDDGQTIIQIALAINLHATSWGSRSSRVNQVRETPK